MSSSEDLRTRLTEVLAEIFSECGLASTLARQAGFRPTQIRRFDHPLVFWQATVDDAHHGATKGGVRALIDRALVLYPWNEILNELAPHFPHPDRVEHPPEPDPTMDDESRLLARLVTPSDDIPSEHIEQILERIRALTQDSLIELIEERPGSTILVLLMRTSAAHTLRVLARAGLLSRHLDIEVDEFELVDYGDDEDGTPGFVPFIDLLDELLRTSRPTVVTHDRWTPLRIATSIDSDGSLRLTVGSRRIPRNSSLHVQVLGASSVRPFELVITIDAPKSGWSITASHSTPFGYERSWSSDQPERCTYTWTEPLHSQEVTIVAHAPRGAISRTTISLSISPGPGPTPQHLVVSSPQVG